VVQVLLVAVAAGVVFSACNGPLPFLSGGRLDGTVKPTPTTWAFAEDFAVIQLETRPAAPYSVNIAYTQLDGSLYIYAGDTETEWVKHMNEDPRVRFRLGDDLYELQAERVTDGDEIAAFAEAWVSHSSIHRDPMELETRWLYRLKGRS
jgi:hypothetical protein